MPKLANLLSRLRLPSERRWLFVIVPLAALAAALALVFWLRNRQGVVFWPKPDHPSVITITVGLPREPDTLFPLTAQTPEAWLILDAVFEPPFHVVTYTYQPGSLTGIPTLENQKAQLIGRAPSGSVGQDTRQVTMTFTFRRDLRWADGTQVTAGDSAFAFELARNPDVDVAWPDAAASVQSYVASGPYSTSVKLQPGLLDPLYFTRVWAPLPRHVLGNQKQEEVAYGDYSRTPMGYGPYTVREWVKGDHITLQRNPYYYRHADGVPRVQFLVFRFIPDPGQRLRMLVSKEIDLALGLELDMIPALLDAAKLGKLKVYAVPGQTWEQLAFNLDDPILGDRAVRQAIALGTDRQAMAEKLEFGLVSPMKSWIVPQHPLYAGDRNLTDYPYDPAGARAALDNAGWLTGPDNIRVKAGQPLSLTVRAASGDPLRVGYLKLFQQNMADIGISVTLQVMPPDHWYGMASGLARRSFQIGVFPWLSGPDPSGREMWSSSQVPTTTNAWQGNNYTGWRNDVNDKIWTTLADTLTAQERKQLYADQQTLFTQELPALPLFQRVVIYAANPKMTGLAPNPTDTLTWNVAEWDIPLK